MRAVCPRSIASIVAENGGVLFDPRTNHLENLAELPPAALLSEIPRATRIPFSTGRVILRPSYPTKGTHARRHPQTRPRPPHHFIKEAVMVLPSGISSESGLRHALARLGISRHNTVGVGDAENDHAFLAYVGFAVAVANAVPALAAHADLVTAAADGAGVRELATALATDLVPFQDRLLGRTVTLGTAIDGTPLAYPAFGPNVLISGTPGDDTSALVGVFIERRYDGYGFVYDCEGRARSPATRHGRATASRERAPPGRGDGSSVAPRATSVRIDVSSPRATREWMPWRVLPTRGAARTRGYRCPHG